ncbi:FUSC family protein [Granulicella sp. L60]|uniref:FUSC family protein n=1 Tax=Granulicella sp. L60 TaxID=1641866 RepID=UPI00131E0393|nr:FUSC family protein [Granulicella sp. L60]
MLDDHETRPSQAPRLTRATTTFLERIDPAAHRRIKGLRLVTAYAIAVALGALQGRSHPLAGGASLGSLAGGFALWACVSEGRTKRTASARDLVLLAIAATLGAVSMIALAPILTGRGHPGPELTLVTGAFLVGFLKRFGILGAGIGSQIYIGQLLAYGALLTRSDLPMVAVAGLIGAIAAILPLILDRPAPLPTPSPAAEDRIPAQEFRMGLQAAAAALVIVFLNDTLHLRESAWAITACTYVIANSTTGTANRVRRRILGTAVGVPLGLLCLPLVIHLPWLGWIAAALAMIIYAMALPERYDIACATFAFTLVVTLFLKGETSISVLASRAWETLIGGALGLATATLILPLRAKQKP